MVNWIIPDLDLENNIHYEDYCKEPETASFPFNGFVSDMLPPSRGCGIHSLIDNSDGLAKSRRVRFSGGVDRDYYHRSDRASHFLRRNNGAGHLYRERKQGYANH